MYQTIITDREAGQRLDKYLHRLLPNAGSGFLYKMLRKKNITLNDKKADGNEKIAVDDSVKIFFAQETLSKFMGREIDHDDSLLKDGAMTAGDEAVAYTAAYEKLSGISVIYENDHVLLADKSAGILSQRAKQTDLSLNEWLIGYLLQSGFLSTDDLRFFKPSVCNRLDRNTSGIVLCAKTLKGARLLSSLLKDRTLHKYYQLYVKGHIVEEQTIAGYLVKDEKRNKVTVKTDEVPLKQSAAEKRSVPSDKNRTLERKSAGRDGSLIQTKYKPLRIEADKTLLEVELITGKPHQIRAHLAGIGHPLLGDYKYGDRAWNEKYRQQFGVQSQLLHAYKVEFPPLDEPFADLDGRTFVCEVPEVFERVSRLVKERMGDK